MSTPGNCLAGPSALYDHKRETVYLSSDSLNLIASVIMFHEGAIQEQVTLRTSPLVTNSSKSPPLES